MQVPSLGWEDPLEKEMVSFLREASFHVYTYPDQKEECLVFLFHIPCPSLGFPGGSDSKESSCNAGYLGSIPGLGRSP